MLVIGGVVRAIVGAAGVERHSDRAVESLPVPATVAAAPPAKSSAVVKVASKSTPTTPVAIVS
jgi:polysaccharide deacetylase 2 family uncharacterized protein YibQ